ncbi:MAG: hypothetical protein ACI8RZ_006866 [Myxococcota bacterium]|jgi:hypothetical protein
MFWMMMIGCGEETVEGISTTGIDDDDTSYTYYTDIKPILEQNCVRCHQDGGLGLGDFTDPELVVNFADTMLVAIDEGRMPPPASDPDCQDYEGSAQLSLSPENRDIIADWTNGGAPLGDEADAVSAEPVETDLVDPDITLFLPAAYTPVYEDAANPGNEYRCFVLDPALEETIYLTAMAPIIDQPSIVHHEVLFTMPRSAMSEADLDPSGYDCIDGLGGDELDGMIAAWAPGMLPIHFPEGAGMRLTPDDVLVMQMHYYTGPDSVGLSDQSGYAFHTTDSVDQRVYMAPLGIFDFSIPAENESYTDGDSFSNDYVDLSIYGMFPHMHVLGSEFSASIKHTDGSETCLVEGDYDFNNQMTYQYLEPIKFEQGAEIEFECTWNNSASNNALEGDSKPTGYGERTDEEMCFFFTLISF